MAAFATEENIARMVGAMMGVVGPGSVKIEAYAQAEAQRYAHAVDALNALYKTGQMTAEELKMHLATQQDADAAVLAGLDTMTHILAAQAMAAGVGAVAGIINGLIGIPLLPTS